MLSVRGSYVAVIVVLIFLFAGPAYGLVFSLHPISDETNTFFEEKLLGKWGNIVEIDLTGDRDGENAETLDFTCEFKKAGAGYDVVVHIEETVKIGFHARLVRVWGENWLQISPSVDSLLKLIGEGGVNPLLLVEHYWFLKVEDLGSELVLSAMDPEWVLERLQTVSRHMEYAYRDYELFEVIYLTSRPHELKPFLARISRHREALPYGVRMTKMPDKDN